MKGDNLIQQHQDFKTVNINRPYFSVAPIFTNKATTRAKKGKQSISKVLNLKNKQTWVDGLASRQSISIPRIL